LLHQPNIETFTAPTLKRIFREAM